MIEVRTHLTPVAVLNEEASGISGRLGRRVSRAWLSPLQHSYHPHHTSSTIPPSAHLDNHALRTFHIHLALRHRINFNVALETYKVQNRRKSNRDLASRPLLRSLPSLQSICDPPRLFSSSFRSDSEQIPLFRQSHNCDDGLTKWDIATVNVLYAFSAALGQDVVVLVNIKIFPRKEFQAPIRWSC